MKRRINLFQVTELKPKEIQPEEKAPSTRKVSQVSAVFEDLDPVTMVMNSETNQFGNKPDYYKTRGTRLSVVDPRLVALDRMYFADKDILDIGCHCGLIPLQLGKYFDVKSVKGMDLDYRLINRATTIWAKEELRVQKAAGKKVEKAHEPGMGQTIDLDTDSESESISTSPLPTANLLQSSNQSTSAQPTYPFNVKFQVCNILQLSPADHPDRYDTIILFSLTKWVQLNFGDAAICTLFRTVKSLLRVGGRLILEAQKFKSYTKLARVCARFQAVYPEIKLRPEEYDKILTQELGLMKEGIFESLCRDSFKRELVVYRRVN